MTTLDPKGREAALVAYAKIAPPAHSEAMYAALRAYLDALSSIPAQPVGVKALEWRLVNGKNDDQSEEADTPFGGYVITADPFTYSPTPAYYVDGPDWFKAQCASVPEAKNAAQADYEARILSALTSHPAAVAVTDEMGDETDEFRSFLIAKSADPLSGISTTERALYALLSLPRAAQALCSEEERETVIRAVEAAMRAALVDRDRVKL